MGWQCVIRIPARPASHSGVRFRWIMEVRAMIVVMISVLLIYQLCIQSRSEDTIPDDISVLLQLELPSMVSPERA
ncbi:hypothetical protein RhiJN_21798 [Ceratobasidium sp. AG-Ba]|nr:hypothetical protein RhiJN_21798 [Ceratobasidium sp. AG-Ba]